MQYSHLGLPRRVSSIPNRVVGAGSGRTFDLEAARYGRIILMADADSDGAHIRCLLATLFFKYMPELVRDGRLFSAVPPLHRIELSNPKKGMDKYIYTYSDDELQRKLAELKKKSAIEISEDNLSKVVIDTGSGSAGPGAGGPMGAPGMTLGPPGMSPTQPPPGTPAMRPVPQGKP